MPPRRHRTCAASWPTRARPPRAPRYRAPFDRRAERGPARVPGALALRRSESSATARPSGVHHRLPGALQAVEHQRPRVVVEHVRPSLPADLARLLAVTAQILDLRGEFAGVGE